MGTPYLAGFDRARLDYSQTNRYTFSEDMKGKVYLHPRHRLTDERPAYDMEDDIYSLGVCLFEIGMWRSMFRWDEEGREYVYDDWLPSLFKEDLGIPLDSLPVDEDEENRYLETTDSNLRADIMKRYVAEMLPQKMGNTYTEVVLTCLTFQDGRIDHDKIDTEISGKRFVESILVKLREARIGKRFRI